MNEAALSAQLSAQEVVLSALVLDLCAREPVVAVQLGERLDALSQRSASPEASAEIDYWIGLLRGTPRPVDGAAPPMPPLPE